MKSRAVILGAFVVAGLGCTPLKMGAPADLAKDADIISVTERSRMTGALANETFKLGPYEIKNVKRGWNSGDSSSGPINDTKSAKTSYGFTFKGPLGEAQAKCGSQIANETFKLLPIDVESSQINIGCVSEGAGANAKFQLAAENDDKLGGPVVAHANNLSVAAISHFSNGVRAREPVGYEFRSGPAVSAVELDYPGKVWMARSLDDQTRADLACLAAGLMLYLPPNHD
jgi:hypothetical protein